MVPPCREATVDGRPLFVFDGLAPLREVVGLQRVLDGDTLQSPVTPKETPDPALPLLTELDTSEPQEGCFQRWAAELGANLFGELELERCFAQRIGTEDDSLDGLSGPGSRDDVVAMWFVCGGWSGTFGGETLFFNDDGEATTCVSPRPGRLVLFDGSIARHQLSPRQDPMGSCYALVYRFKRVAPRESRLIDSRSG